ncbi:MAG: lamin tail domain-containing protein [Melioribacteraceae bacterium]|nr:lamin tail domain-containing protein [Melioribacteraceae bacterium]
MSAIAQSNLGSGETITQNFNIGSFSEGNVQLIAQVVFNQDEDNSNNELIREFSIIASPPDFNAIVINEIMYAPQNDEPEWVEIYNRSNESYDLANWQFSDASSTSLITTESITISPNEYIILAKDASVEDFY